ncbi:MAG: glycosyltransferase family 2 protein [Planctomycetes bacterium]|nr:glycosyltransferase family 2 protein [Planctomycetota bacterium]
MTLLSIVIPVFNEVATVERCVRRVLAAALPQGVQLEIVAVDDASTDGSAEVLSKLVAQWPGVSVVRHSKNSGKGAALRTGFAAARGDIVLVQDADLEYDPSDYLVLLAPLLDGRADVVFGSRFRGGTHRVHLFAHYMGNRFLTLVSNLCTGLNLTDMETCYKVMRRSVVERLELCANRFDVEPEITAKVARMGAKVYEVPVSYSGRDFDEGKKIRWFDGFSALWAIARFNFLSAAPKRLPRQQRQD